MKRLLSILLVLCLTLVAFAGCAKPAQETPAPAEATEAVAEELVTETTEAVTEESTEPYTVGFVTFGLGGDFFQQLADAYVAKMTELGWEASYADGKFDPTAQLEACENYVAMGVDALVIWAVAPEALSGVVDQAMQAGIKVVAFVAPTEKYDVLMIADNVELANFGAKLAGQWIDKTYADAPDHSVPVAVLSCRTAQTGAVQADALMTIEQYSQKAKFALEVECSDEAAETGQAKAEDLYNTNPEIQVFLSAHNGLALGVNNYYTSLSSPVTDYSKMGIFTINGDMAIAELIKSSINNESPLRGMVLTGGVADTANDIAMMLTGIMDGTIASGFVQKAATIFVNADSVEEYITTGHVTTLTAENFK